MDDSDEDVEREEGKRGSVPPLRALDRESEDSDLSTALENRREEELALLEERVTPIVRDFMARNEALFHEKNNFTDDDQEQRWFAWAALLRTAQLAILLADSDAAQRLLPFVKNTRRFKRHPEDETIGRLSLLVGDVETATALIEHNTAAQGPIDSWCTYYMIAAKIAADLPDTTIAKLLLLEIEREGKQRNESALISHAAEIAFRIGDATTLTRIMQQAERIQVYYKAVDYRLPLFAPYHPEAAERLMKRKIAEYAESQERSQWDLARMGETAAVLGDSDTARAIMDTLKDQRFYTHVSEIAAVLGDVETAEEMMWTARRTGQWKGYHFDHFTAAWHNPGAAYYLMRALLKEGYEIGLRAVDILEWGCKGKWIIESFTSRGLRRMRD